MNNETNYNSQPAFPTNEFGYVDGNEVWYLTPGMTLLDYFAGQLITNLNGPANRSVEDAYLIAAAMIEERKKYIKD